MKFYSTKNKSSRFSFREAVLAGLPPDNGLFMPEKINVLPEKFINEIENYSLADIGFEVSKTLLGDSIPDEVLQKITSEAFNFPVVVNKLDNDTFIAELYHGPTLAFKDFGARFMARVMSYLNKEEVQPLTILVATSGDTGGAVADGFFKIPGIDVIILYPSGGVSLLQEKQLTTYGENIHAVEVKGTFDDCQQLVKSAFLDNDLRQNYRLSSANSINITRLIPQAIYYFEAYKLAGKNKQTVFAVPSGNFGNLTAGLLAKRAGLPVHHFVAATNVNDIVPNYLSSGKYDPRASTATISNAMDVGDPSNFGRMADLFNQSVDEMRNEISGYRFTDDETRWMMKKIYSSSGYVLDPHGAVGLAGWQEYHKSNPGTKGIVLETAHPAKFIDVVEAVLEKKIDIPGSLEKLRNRTKVATVLPADFSLFKEFLLSRS